MISCVYKITNICNGRIYIGQTTNFKQRVNEHKSDLRLNKHSNPDLQEDYFIYGIENFKFEILEKCNKYDLLELETKYINKYGGKENIKLYNRCDLYGHNKLYRYNQAQAQIGNHKITFDGRQRISMANKGKIISEQQKEKIKKAAKCNPNYGMKNKKHSEYSKQLMSIKKKGKYIGSSNSNYKYSEQFKQQLRDEYNICKNYTQLGKKYNINRSTISNLIRFNHC